MKQSLLLLKDVDGLGRCGEVVSAKPGFVRNFLLPQKHAVIADKHTLKMQARLQEERARHADVDRKEAQALALKFAELVVDIEVKVDHDGKMYGSVNQADMVKLVNAKGFAIERRTITLPQAIKKLGKYTIPLRLKEGVEASFTLEVKPEGGVIPQRREVEALLPTEETKEDAPKAE